MAHLQYHSHGWDIWHHVDDTSVLLSADSEAELQSNMNLAIDFMTKWFSANKTTTILIHCWKQAIAWQWIPLIKSKSLGFFSYKTVHHANVHSDQPFYILISKM